MPHPVCHDINRNYIFFCFGFFILNPWMRVCKKIYFVPICSVFFCENILGYGWCITLHVSNYDNMISIVFDDCKNCEIYRMFQNETGKICRMVVMMQYQPKKFNRIYFLCPIVFYFRDVIC